MDQTRVAETGSGDVERHLWGKEPELVREVELYQLDLVGLTSTVSALVLYSWIGCWTLFFSEVAQAGVGILINSCSCYSTPSCCLCV